jgi:hypothetical protein
MIILLVIIRGILPDRCLNIDLNTGQVSEMKSDLLFYIKVLYELD